jgi:thioredoxin 1
MSKLLSVTDDTFEREVLANEGDVLVEFSATWCPPCKALAPILESIAEERASSLKVVVVDIDASPRTSTKYKVRGAPTLVLFRKGERAASQLGAVPKSKLIAMLES